MHFFTYALTYVGCLFVGMLICLKAGHMLGRKRRPREKEDGGNALDGVVFALLGLLLAFSFSESLTNYNAHRDHLTKEANDIAGLHSHLNLLPNEHGAAIRSLLVPYAEARLDATRATVNSPAELEALNRGERLQNEIWARIVAFAHASSNGVAANQIIDAFDAMAGAPAELSADKRSHMPKIIYILIFVLTLMSALVAGYGMAEHAMLPTIRIVIFSVAVVATIYVIVDLEYPRSGFLNSAPDNQTLSEVIADMR